VVIRDTTFGSMGAVEPPAWMSAAARRWLENAGATVEDAPGRGFNALPLSGVRVSLAERGRALCSLHVPPHLTVRASPSLLPPIPALVETKGRVIGSWLGSLPPLPLVRTRRGTGMRAPSRRRRTTCAPRPSCPWRASSRSPSTTTSPTLQRPSSMCVHTTPLSSPVSRISLRL
jgi:hypothetical protein